MSSLRIPRPGSILLSPCSRAYSRRYDDLFYSRIDRAIKLTLENPIKHRAEIDKALLAAIKMKSKEEVCLDLLYLPWEYDHVYNYLTERIDELTSNSLRVCCETPQNIKSCA